ncbi:major facilitator family domain-containing protein [Cyclospora cayetanensis]|uniref:Major facilitator family domain-containing protein n=1 Tax=Cyclospora cayetanensis TaxID=88456 RepID=A0A1D3CTL3_9EIME|nr:major facilitator family domain-containing protein [Cyclospora cayetanensis]
MTRFKKKVQEAQRKSSTSAQGQQHEQQPNQGTVAESTAPAEALPNQPVAAVVATGDSLPASLLRKPSEFRDPSESRGKGSVAFLGRDGLPVEPSSSRMIAKSPPGKAPAFSQGRQEAANTAGKARTPGDAMPIGTRKMSREGGTSVLSTCDPSEVHTPEPAPVSLSKSDDLRGSGLSPLPSLTGSFALAVTAQEEGERSRATCTGGVNWAFALFFFLEVFVNFDSGVVPAILPTLQKEFNLDGVTEGQIPLPTPAYVAAFVAASVVASGAACLEAGGLLGALPYVGLSLSSPFVGRGLTLFSPKYFCLFTMLVNIVATGLFGLATNRWMLFFSRFLIGLTQSGISIYAPVWVDRFAPSDKLTLWMGLAQGGVVVGTMLGCVTAGALDAARQSGLEFFHWRHALAIQFLWLLVLVTVWGFTPRSLLEIQLKPSAVDDSDIVSSVSAVSMECVEFGASGEESISQNKARSFPPAFAAAANSQGSERKNRPILIGATTSVVPTSPMQSRRGRTALWFLNEEGGRRGSQRRATTGIEKRISSEGPRKSLRPTHRQSDLPEYLKDPLSNFLPLDFFASNAQPCRVSRLQSAATAGTRRTESSHHRQNGFGEEAIGYMEGSSLPRGIGAPLAQRECSVGRGNSACNEKCSRGVSLRRRNPWGHEESCGGGRRQSSNNFQYQMTFLTPHPTTLAFEALNWASGAQDPMLLVQRDARQPQAPSAQQSSGRVEGSFSGGGNGRGTPSTSRATAGEQAPSTVLQDGDAQDLSNIDLEKDTQGALPQDACAERRHSTKADASRVAAPIKTFGVRDSIRILFSSPLYVCVTFSLCALFFEVTAIQFWSITYFQEVLKRPASTVLVACNATAATAPILGVLGGGWLVDFVGGYKDERGMRRVMVILLSWATICFLLGIAAGCSTNFWIVVLCMWWIMFFGGGILPAATGIVITSVPVEVRAFGSGFCMMIYNLLGYVLGTFLPGILIEAASLVWGMRVIYLWSFNGLVGLALACCFLWRLEIKPTFISDVGSASTWTQQQDFENDNARRETQEGLQQKAVCVRVN